MYSVGRDCDTMEPARGCFCHASMLTQPPEECKLVHQSSVCCAQAYKKPIILVFCAVAIWRHAATGCLAAHDKAGSIQRGGGGWAAHGGWVASLSIPTHHRVDWHVNQQHTTSGHMNNAVSMSMFCVQRQPIIWHYELTHDHM